MADATISDRTIPENFETMLEEFGLELYSHREELREELRQAELESIAFGLRAKIHRITQIMDVIDSTALPM